MKLYQTQRQQQRRQQQHSNYTIPPSRGVAGCPRARRGSILATFGGISLTVASTNNEDNTRRQLKSQQQESATQHQTFTTVWKQWFSSVPVVFFGARGYSPAYIPWLNTIILAGDVHPNPGPRCVKCGGLLRAGNTPVMCGVCQALFHKQCCGLTRTQTDRLFADGQAQAFWICRRHGKVDEARAGDEEEAGSIDTAWKGSQCAKCRGPMRQAAVIPRCNLCSRWFHQKETCSGVARSAWASMVWAEWRCSGCRAGGAQGLLANYPNEMVPKAQAKAMTGKQVIRICQWNADGIKPKVYELERWAKENRVDVILIQESKLNEHTKFEGVTGYSTVRHDRTKIRNSAERRGGGLLTLVKEDLSYKKISASGNSIIEELSIEVWLDNRESLTITNVYRPPIRNTQAENRQTEDLVQALKPCARHVIAADANIHSPLWDSGATDNEEATQMVLWAAEHDYHIMNDPIRHTHINRSSGNTGSPDVTIVSMDLAHLATWKVVRGMSSDHFPIIIDIMKPNYRAPEQPRLKWAWKKADWKKYQAYLQQQKMPESLPLSAKAAWLTTTLNQAVAQSVPLKKCCKRNKPYWSSALKEINRRRLIAQLNGRMEELRTINEEWRKQVLVEKKRCWQEHVSKLQEGDDQRKLWQTIRKLNGQAIKPRNEMLVYKDRARVSEKQKASAFIEHYSDVSRLTLTKEERLQRNRNDVAIKERAHDDTPYEEDQLFTMTELRVAISQMNDTKKGGDDRVEPPMVSHLPQNMLETLLQIYNDSWSSGVTPGKWKMAVIIPLLKDGKPADNVESYRPISLTSVLAKVMERMVANRLGYWLESHSVIQKWQLGFQRLKSTEQQCTRLIQDIYDGFQAKPTKRTVAVMLDCSKAYDRVWKERLILKMNEAKVPLVMLRWIKGFLEDRKAKVRLGDAQSKCRKMTQGLPQGAVLSPTLFLLYTSDLLATPAADVQISGYADDVAIWATSRSIDEASAKVQAAVTQVEEWARTNKVELNATKSEGIVCSSYNRDWAATPVVTVNGNPLRFVKTCRFLGVYVDNGLSFNHHVQYIAEKMRSRTRILSALTGKDWGSDRQTMRSIYNATIESVLWYAAVSWMPYISATNFGVLEREQKRAAKIITGLIATTPSEAVWREAEIIPARTRGRMQAVRMYDRTLRLPEDHPLRKTAMRHVPNRFERTKGWREESRMALFELTGPEAVREGFTHIRPKPWEEMSRLNLHDSLRGGSNKSSNKDALMTDVADTMSMLLEQTAVAIYTDGSVSGDNKNGGCAAVMMRGDERLGVSMEPVGTLCASYDAELSAIRLAAQWIETNEPGSAVIFTDSKASIQSLANAARYDEPHLMRARIALQRATRTNMVIVQWIPSHCGIPGNEEVDRVASEACKNHQPSVITWTAVKSTLKRTLVMPPVADERRARIYTKRLKCDQTLSRKEQVLLAQLRSGHCLKSPHYRKKFLPEEGHCNKCGDAEPDADHFWNCDATVIKRRNFVNCELVEEALRERESEVIQYLREAWPDWLD